MAGMSMYCNNCGQQGHVFRTCKDPIISCGVLLLRSMYEPMKLPVDPRTVSVLMVKRKDSMAYVEFIRGKYDLGNIAFVEKLVSNMTQLEQKWIVEETFEMLWNKLWGNGRDSHGLEFDLASDRFNSLDRKALVTNFPSKYRDPEWGFPKGRRMRGETDLECAVREFYEETNIPKESYRIIPNISFTEVFKGTNNVMYKHVYYIALLENSKCMNLKQKLTIAQRREVSAVDWKTLLESKSITRPHYVERKKVIDEVELYISSSDVKK
jgi:8-oxo-dGTP pyrophosphatase MutT (NUDIX family)